MHFYLIDAVPHVASNNITSSVLCNVNYKVNSLFSKRVNARTFVFQYNLRKCVIVL